MRRKKLLPYAGISRQVKRSGLTFFNLFSSLANMCQILFNCFPSLPADGQRMQAIGICRIICRFNWDVKVITKKLSLCFVPEVKARMLNIQIRIGAVSWAKPMICRERYAPTINIALNLQFPEPNPVHPQARLQKNRTYL